MKLEGGFPRCAVTYLCGGITTSDVIDESPQVQRVSLVMHSTKIHFQFMLKFSGIQYLNFKKTLFIKYLKYFACECIKTKPTPNRTLKPTPTRTLTQTIPKSRKLNVACPIPKTKFRLKLSGRKLQNFQDLDCMIPDICDVTIILFSR